MGIHLKRRMSQFVIVLYPFLLFMVAACAEEKEPMVKKEDIQTIEAVLRNSLTGPSDELRSILDKESEGKSDTLHQYEERKFKEYFANETSYTEFINSYGSGLMVEPINNDYQLKIKTIDYEKTAAKDSVYNFSIELELLKEGSEKLHVENVSGQANLNDEHKIEEMLIRTEELYKSMTN